MNTLPENLLTEREQEVLTLIEGGLSNKSIAEQLFLSPNTIAWHVQQIFSKLGVNRRTQAVAVAREGNLLPSPSSPPLNRHSTHHLPTQLTSFIGREKDIEDIQKLLTSSECHLLTLVGPGGMGKTRLAIEVATQLIQEFPDGIYFVALQPLTSADTIVSTIADALGIQLLSDRLNAERRLFEFFQNKTTLLIFDNFEHVMDGTQTVSQLLTAAPDLKILVTSRASLNLYEENLYTLDGLTFPADGETNPANEFSAVQLFAERAHQVFPAFEVNGQLHNIVRLCQLVDGIPLAIEFAASWLKSLSCEEIITEIEHGLGILKTPLRNLPERHRSIKAVFDYSWQLLDEDEKRTCRRLSVFRGGFRWRAAETITGTTHLLLQGLIDKSFLRRNPKTGRYDMHELVRQYAHEQLDQSDDDIDEIEYLHSQYYMTLLANHHADVTNQSQLDMMNTLEPDLDNIRMAWTVAVYRQNIKAIENALNTFAYFHVFRSRFVEEAEVLEVTIEMLTTPEISEQQIRLLAELHSYCGWIYIRIGDYERATERFTHSYNLYTTYKLVALPGWGSEPLTGLTLLASIQGDYEQATAYGAQSRQLALEHDDPWNLQLALYCSTSAAYHQGNTDDAYCFARNALEISEQSGDLWFRAIVLNDLGNIARNADDYEQAKGYFRHSLEIRRQFNDAQGIAAALYNLGMIALCENDIDEARRLFLESYTRYRDVGDHGGTGYSLCKLGRVALMQGDLQQARSDFSQALVIAHRLGYIPLTFAVLIDICPLLLEEACANLCVEIIALTLCHKQSNFEAGENARKLQHTIEDDLAHRLDIVAYEQAWKRGQSSQPDVILEKLLNHFL